MGAIGSEGGRNAREMVRVSSLFCDGTLHPSLLFAFGMLLAFGHADGHQCCSVDRFAASCGGGMSQKVVDRMRYVLRHCRSFAVRWGAPKQTPKRWGRALTGDDRKWDVQFVDRGCTNKTDCACKGISHSVRRKKWKAQAFQWGSGLLVLQ